jgi:uncharacterized membrane protein YkvA (DUF1232 family)
MPMNPTASSIPDALQKHLSTNSSEDVPSLAQYVDQGAALVNAEAIEALRALRAPLQAKTAAVEGSAVLRQRLELLTHYFLATSYATTDAATQREVAFALLYFLKGFDRIPDSVPEVGLLDDAMIVQTVMQRNETVLEAFALRHARSGVGDI